MNQSDALAVSKVVASNVTELMGLLDASMAGRIVYEYDGTIFEGTAVRVALAESSGIRKDGSIRRRMMVFVSDELWLQLVKNVIQDDDELRLLRRLSDSTLLTFRDRSYDWARDLFHKYEVDKNGKVYEASSLEGFKALLALAAQDNHPARKGQPLFMMHRYEFNEQYTASVKDGRLLIHVPELVVDSIKLKLRQSRKSYC